MYLKSLRMVGFKSFANSVELTFDPNITAIIGPNGSGKSNIIDAIRWVLGEQSSKSLRGKQMDDVIFSGTSFHNPMGYAEVTILLDNSDRYFSEFPDEVSITRRLFKTGESAYLINNQSVRLRDIHAIFADTGLGKNGYSIVGQGNIENIINSDPDTLRRIIEEAVGIVNYKSREHEAQKELDSAQVNMERIQDLMLELERQRTPLSKQAEKAKRYLDLKEKLKRLDLISFQKEYQALERKKSENQKALDQCNDEINKIKIDIHDADAQYQRLRVQKKKILESKKESDLLFEEISKNNVNVEKDKAHIEEQINRTTFEIGRCNELITDLSTQKDENQKKIDEIADEIQALQKDNERLRHEQALQQKKGNAHAQAIGKIQAQLTKAQGLDKNFQSEREKNKDKIAQYDSELSVIEEKINIRMQHIRNEKNTISENKKHYEREHAKLEQDQKQAAETQRQLSEAQETLNQLKDEEKKLSKQIYQLRNDQSLLRTRTDYLKRVQSQFLDYVPGTRWIMSRKSSMPKQIQHNIFGPVGDLIEVPNNLIYAIDSALGRKTQNIIVADVDTARYCIELLKKNRSGRVTFLPLSNLKNNQISEGEKSSFAHFEGYVGIASDLIRFSPEIQPAVESLLGRVIVIDKFDAARQMRHVVKYYMIVTLDGEIFYAGGAIVGGRQKKNQSTYRYNKKDELKTYALQEKKMAAQIADCDRKLAVVQKSRSTQQHNYLKLKAHDEEVKRLIFEENHKSKTLIKTNLDIHTNIDQEEKECQQLKNRFSDIQKSIKKIKELITKDDTNDHAVNQSDIQNQLNALHQKQRENDRIIAKYNIAIAKNNEGIKLKKKQSENVKQQIDQLIQKIEAQSNLSKELEMAAKQSKARLKEIDQSILLLQKRENDRKEKANLFEESEAKIDEQIEDTDRKIRTLNHQQVLQNEELNKLQIASHRILTVRQNMSDKMMRRYDMNLTMISDWLRNKNWDETAVDKSSIQSLEQQIKDLGNVNVNAIEDYEEINQRYLFIQNQYHDLLKSKEKIEKMIQDLQKEMTERFDFEFKKLQLYFSQIFKELFGGGKANLFYMDPQNILQSGIGLEAQPPGKNLKQLSLMSGGEKAMTAICLLFAFLKLNPSPFCIIDEVDAALDDQNIYRFTTYLKKIYDQTQFILITHRKNTLKICDSIYGISMTNTGISKIVSVKISDYI